MKISIFSNKVVTIILAVVVSILWGTLFPTIKIGYQAFGIESSAVASILLFAGVRFFLSGILLVGGEIIKMKKVALPKRDQLLPICIVSLLTVVLHYTFTYIGLSLTESSKSSVLKQIAFLIVPAIAFLFRKEDRCSPKKILAAVLGFLAVLTVNIEGLDLIFGAGELLIILASFCSMIGQMVSKNVYDKHEPAHIVAYAQLLGGATLLVSGLLFGGRLEQLSLQSIGVLSYICFASIAANLLWNTLIKYNDMSRLSVLKSMDPLFASLFSALLLGENILKPTYLVAVALIILAIISSNYKRRVQKI